MPLPRSETGWTSGQLEALNKKTPNKWDTILYHRCILTDFMKGIIQMVIFWDTNHSVGLSERGLYRNKMFCMNSEHDD